jgi:hypothetical protein
MKTLLIIITGITMLIATAQVKTARSSDRIEQHQYNVIKTYNDFEIRQYEPAIFARTRVDATGFRSGSSAAFRTLASYIFGGNDRNENIAMTAPVAMHHGQGLEMEFMMPSKYTIESLPAPNRQDIEFYEKPGVVMAAIRFSGRAPDARIAEMTNKLKAMLKEQGINHTGQFIYLGYNPPYQIFNRRNEVVVEILR